MTAPTRPLLPKPRRRRPDPVVSAAAAAIAAELLAGDGNLRQRTFDFLTGKLPEGPQAARNATGKGKV